MFPSSQSSAYFWLRIIADSGDYSKRWEFTKTCLNNEFFQSIVKYIVIKFKNKEHMPKYEIIAASPLAFGQKKRWKKTCLP